MDTAVHLSVTLQAEVPADGPAVERLIARAFGPGRYAKAAGRLREGNLPRLDLSIVARAHGEVVGCARLWPIVIGAVPGVLLGPFAVDEGWRGRGLGGALIRRACEGARTAGEAAVLLVGDESYFGPFGFSAEPARRIDMPGPVDPFRVLVQVLRPTWELAGRVAPAIPRRKSREGL